MVTSSHEASHRIFQDRPELLAPVFRILGVPLPTPATVEVLSPDTTEIRPLERRVDSVLRIEPQEGRSGGFLLAIEAQGRRDRIKPKSWAYYLAHLGAKYECPVLLLVTCMGTYFPGRGTIVEESFLKGVERDARKGWRPGGSRSGHR